MIRREPVQTALVTLFPVLLAFAQVGNSVLNGLSFGVSIPFALGLLGFAGVIDRYRFAAFRRKELERELVELI